ncbi:hypothetical protein Agub_g5257, partial [Astrephomene gubernaculifera]
MTTVGLRYPNSSTVAPGATAPGQVSISGLTTDGRAVLNFPLVTSTGVFPDNYLPALEGRLPCEVYKDILAHLNSAAGSFKTSRLRCVLNALCILCTGGLAGPLWVLPNTYRRHSKREAALQAAIRRLNARYGPPLGLNLRRNAEGEAVLQAKGVRRGLRVDL